MTYVAPDIPARPVNAGVAVMVIVTNVENQMRQIDLDNEPNLSVDEVGAEASLESCVDTGDVQQAVL